jgi:peptidoglycan/LPS O-acetylase OafA/YrhL
MNQIASDRPYYPALDGLRGIAILLVVIYHNFGFTNYFYFGWLGVDLFFVLSGFLITSILIATEIEKRDLKNFFVRRILRIFPLYYLALAITLFILPLFSSFSMDISYYRQHQAWLWTYTQNWLYILSLPKNNFLIHFWSLAVEEQFYLVWPFIILLLKKTNKLLLLLSLTLILVIATRFLVWVYKVENIEYFGLYTFTRIDGICIGCMVALLQKTNRTFLEKYTAVIVFSLAGLNFLFYFINKMHAFTFPYLAIVGYTTFAAMFGLLVYEVISGTTRIINKVLSSGFLKFFGKISYGLYIFHLPVYLLVTPYLKNIITGKYSASANETDLIASVAATFIAIIISYLSYRFFESFFIKLKNKFI